MCRTAKKARCAGIGGICLLVMIVTATTSATLVASDVPADWIEISAGREFNLMAPPGTKLRPSSGIDSSVGRLDAPNFHLTFEYGLYSNRLADLESDAAYAARSVTIDNKAATIVTAHTPRLSTAHPYFIGIHFPEVRTTAVGPTKLTMFGLVDSTDHYAAIETIFQSIRFK